MMRNRFDEQLNELNSEMIRMGALCEEVIALAAKALDEGDRALAKKVAPLDTQIDQKERTIETLCLRLLLQQQPVARDLRQISAALKMITDLERIGDQAVDIAEMSVYIKDKKQVFNLTHILEMADNASKMVTEAIDAFVKSDIEVAKKVARQDDIVDELFNRSKNETVELIHKNKELGSEALDIVMIAKYLERIADHAVNVAEWVAFSITGSCDLPD